MRRGRIDCYTVTLITVTAPVCFLECFHGGGAQGTQVTDSEVRRSWILQGPEPSVMEGTLESDTLLTKRTLFEKCS